ncbi:semaphorin-5B-like isoform X2 [Mercenaria mercenaria]|uniref:semaphorin-5B-like isoform X2 n=1 Tax=Mercenaria mercenaria TaxID=6596 RepID=UPI00234F29E9|nr:semaphorin-5B-like isoform X2 [Mercenaria mercenaria]
MEGTHLEEKLNINTVSRLKVRAQDDRVEQADTELYEQTGVVLTVIEKTNSRRREKCETLQTAPKEEHKTDASKVAIYMTWQKVMFIFVLASVLMSSVSLIDLIIHLRAEAVDGSWSDWGSWEACSTTCGVGLQTRHRNCSSPAPLGDGRQCLGEVNEHRLCMPGPCSNGGWSAWGRWGSCSASCDVGLKSRLRTCTRPRPSPFGSFCEGDNMQTEICGGEPCSDRGWSAWGSWGSCSASCDVGLKSRLRTCTRPRPSPFGSFCEGDNTQAEICGREPCSETRVAFNVYESSVTGYNESHTVIFTRILLNEGQAYN